MLLGETVYFRINYVLLFLFNTMYLNNADLAIFPKGTDDACRKSTSFALLYVQSFLDFSEIMSVKRIQIIFLDCKNIEGFLWNLNSMSGSSVVEVYQINIKC